ncbi:S10 family serine carboxypeptidase-like protein [Pigmentibacter ruber]
MKKISFTYQKRMIIFLILFNILSFYACGRKNSSGVSDKSPIYSFPNGGTDSDISATNSFYFDPVVYGKNEEDNITDKFEDLVTASSTWYNAQKLLNYSISGGHIVTLDSNRNIPNAKIFYLAYTLNQNERKSRPITFVLNGGPGKTQFLSAIGAFAPKIVNNLKNALTNNEHSIFEQTDMVFISPVGTGYSAAISPFVNKDFWGVDFDAKNTMEFITRYLQKNLREESPIYLMGDTYGSVRSILSAQYLFKNMIKVKGIIMLSPLINYSKWLDPIGVFPTLAANAWYHQKVSIELGNKSINDFLDEVMNFTKNKYYPFFNSWRDNYSEFRNLLYKNSDKETAELIEKIIPSSLSYSEIILILQNGNIYQKKLAENLGNLIQLLQPMDWNLANEASKFTNTIPKVFRDLSELKFNTEPFFDLLNFHLKTLLGNQNNNISAYDGRKIGNYKSIYLEDILHVDNDSDFLFIQNDFLDLWHKLLNEELKFYSASEFIASNEKAEKIWNYHHVNKLNTFNNSIFEMNFFDDFLKLLNLNSEIKIFLANGIYDSVTPFYQNVIELKKYFSDAIVNKNIKLLNYNSGHFIYLDPISRDLLQNDIKSFYN